MKKQKLLVRQEESVKSEMSQTLHGPYMNDKSKKLLQQRERAGSQNRLPTAVNTQTPKHFQSVQMFKDASQIRTPKNKFGDENKLTFHPQISKKSRELSRDRPV